MKRKVGIGVLIVSLILIAGGVILSFQVKEYTIKFTGIDSMKMVKVKSGSYTKRPEDPVKEGYTFVGWYNEGNLYDFNSKVEKDIVLVAKWEKTLDNGINDNDYKSFTVSFNTEGGSLIDQVNVKEGEIIPRPSDPVKEGYTLVEWQLDGKKYDFNAKITSNITLKAVWKKAQDDKNEMFTITFDTDGGSKINNQTVNKNEIVNKPVDPTKKDYQFVEWQLNGKKYDFNTKVTSNITLKAIWKVSDKSFKVTFNSNGGTKIASQTVKEGKSAVKPANPNKDGYQFVSWQLDGKDYDFSNKVSKNITLVAKYRTLKTLLVKFDTDGGNTIPSQNVIEGNKLVATTTPIKEGYKFVEWQLNGKKYDFNTKVTSNMTLKALWVEEE